MLEDINDIIFWRRKKKRRKFEKENNLPKKIMINPLIILKGLILFIVIIGLTIYQLYFSLKVHK